MKEANMINEKEYALITRARRIRNRLAHRFHEFETSDERFKQEMLHSLKEACNLLKEYV